MTELSTSDFYPAQPVQNRTPKSTKTQLLTDQLIELLFTGHISFSQAATQLDITRGRAYRLWDKWKLSSEAQKVDIEWWSLYLKLREENPEKALECLTRIKYRMITEKHEVKAEIKEIRLEWNVKANAPDTVPTS